MAVAKNPSISQSILKELSQDKAYEVRKAVAENPNTSLETLKELAKDNAFDIKMIALKRLKDYEQV